MVPKTNPPLLPWLHSIAWAIRIFTCGYKYVVTTSPWSCAMCSAVTWSGAAVGTSLGHQTAAQLSQQSCGQEGDPFIPHL